MACPQLTLVPEVFGPAIQSPVGGAAPVRGQWVGLQRQDGVEKSTDATGVTVRVTESSAASAIKVAVTVGAVEKAVSLPWSGGVVDLVASRLPGADFLVIRNVVDALAGAHRWTYVVFDLRIPTTTGANPSVLGPFDLPAGVVQLNFCPDPSGRLVLLWDGYPASVAGRTAGVYRTDRNASSSADALVSVDAPAATGVIACKVETNPAPGLLSIYDDALVQPAGLALPNPPQPPLASQPAPRPGKLRLTPRTLALAAADASATFTVSNQGEDVLEVTAVSVPAAAPVTLAPGLALPACLMPGDSFPVTVGRGVAGAATTTATVTTTPAAAAGSNTVTVNLAALVPDPRATVTPTTHTWKSGETDVRSVVVKNVGNVPLDVGLTTLPMASAFTLAPIAGTVAPGGFLTAKVTPPATCPGGPVNASFDVLASLSPVATAASPMIPGFPVTVALAACVPIVVKVPKGSLRITTIEADAPGDDIRPEGEFIEILNVTSGPLDLTGCHLQDRVISAAGVPGGFKNFFQFGPAVFGADSMLPPGRVLRVLTRQKTAADANRAFTLFAGFRQAVWNNTGDTGRILDENGSIVDEYTYVTKAPAAGVALAPGTVFSAPRARTRALVRRVYVDASMDWTSLFEVEDGDLVTITASGTARFGLFGGQIGADGAAGPVTPAGQGWPLEGVPPYALIGSLEDGPPFLVGSTASLTFNLNSRPLMLNLGPNDGELWDNAGVFDCLAILYR